ncbi:hypothetical protein D3C72_2355900 [compost metagenome]
MGNSIPYFHFTSFLDTRNNITYIPCLDDFFWHLIELQRTDLIRKVLFASRYEFYSVPFTDFAIFNFEIGHDTTE